MWDTCFLLQKRGGKTFIEVWGMPRIRVIPMASKHPLEC